MSDIAGEMPACDNSAARPRPAAMPASGPSQRAPPVAGAAVRAAEAAGAAAVD
jgi:hypothetical protein